MELRRGCRSAYKDRYRLTHFGKMVMVTFVVLLLSVWIASSGLGKWISKEFFYPIFTKQQGSGNDAPLEDSLPVFTDEGRQRTQKYTISSLPCFCLQTGAFSAYENALNHAQTLRSKGAAGYIYQDGSIYRVLAAGYETREECKTVQTQLKEGGIDSTLYMIPLDTRTMELSGNGEKLDIYCTSLDYLSNLSGRIYSISLTFDRDALSLEDGREQLKLLEDELKQVYRCFEAASIGETALDRSINQLFEGMIHEMDDVLSGAEASRIAFTSSLKWQRLYAAFAVSKLIRGEIS